MLSGENRKQIIWLVIGLNVFSLAWYFFIAYAYGFWQNIPSSMFAASDTGTYLKVADWIAGRTDNPQALLGRPFLYPLLLALIRSVSNSAYAIWFVQFVFWGLAVNLTALSAYRLTATKFVFIVVFVIANLNLSLLSLTFYGLTESTAFLLLACWLFCWSRREEKPGRSTHILLVLLLSLLTVVKPVFQVPLLVFVVYLAWRNRKNYRVIGLLAAACLPVLAQLMLVYTLFGAFTISNIPAYNLRHYFFAQIYADKQGMALNDEADYNALQTEVRQFSDREIYRFLLSHPLQSARGYGKNIRESLLAGAATLLDYPSLYTLTTLTNRLYLLLHLVFCGRIFYGVWRRRGAVRRVFFPLLFSYWICFSAGTAYWQGDRLVVTALPLWLVAYSYLANEWRSSATSSALPHLN